MNTTAKIITGTIAVCLCVAMVLSWRDRSDRKKDELTRGHWWCG
jgi:hypothetical protein